MGIEGGASADLYICRERERERERKHVIKQKASKNLNYTACEEDETHEPK